MIAPSEDSCGLSDWNLCNGPPVTSTYGNCN